MADDEPKEPPSRKRHTKKHRIPKSSVIYVKIAGRDEQVEVYTGMTDDEVVELFTTAAEVNPRHVLKMYTGGTPRRQHRLCADITPNTPSTRYTLEMAFVAMEPATAALKLGFNALEMGKKIEYLENLLRVITSGSQSNAEMEETASIDIISEISSQTRRLIDKVLTRPHLEWLGFSKPDWYGSKFVNSEDTFNDLTAWNMGCPPQSMHDEHARLTIDRFRRYSDSVVSRSVILTLRSNKFDNWQWDDHELMILMREMYRDLGLHITFNIDMSRLDEWLIKVYYYYNEVPYHSFKHCFMVTQMAYALIYLFELNQILSEFDFMVLLTSAVCHDINHPGLSNTFQINGRTILGLRYNDIAPLENHHCALAAQLIVDPHSNPFINLTAEKFRDLRRRMIQCILATEMSRHKDFIENLVGIAPVFDVQEEEHKDLLMNLLVKAADVSNEVRPFDVSMPWIQCLCNEFGNQYDLEKKIGIPATPFMNMKQISKASSQIGFIKFVLLPLFDALLLLFPPVHENLLKPIHRSLTYWLAIEEEMSSKNENTDTLMQLTAMIAELQSFDLSPSSFMLRMNKY